MLSSSWSIQEGLPAYFRHRCPERNPGCMGGRSLTILSLFVRGRRGRRTLEKAVIAAGGGILSLAVHPVLIFGFQTGCILQPSPVYFTVLSLYQGESLRQQGRGYWPKLPFGAGRMGIVPAFLTAPPELPWVCCRAEGRQSLAVPSHPAAGLPGHSRSSIAVAAAR